MLEQRHKDIGNKENIYIDPNSCLSDLSDSTEFYIMHLHEEKLESLQHLYHLGRLEHKKPLTDVNVYL